MRFTFKKNKINPVLISRDTGKVVRKLSVYGEEMTSIDYKLELLRDIKKKGFNGKLRWICDYDLLDILGDKGAELSKREDMTADIDNIIKGLKKLKKSGITFVPDYVSVEDLDCYGRGADALRDSLAYAEWTLARALVNYKGGIKLVDKIGKVKRHSELLKIKKILRDEYKMTITEISYIESAGSPALKFLTYVTSSNSAYAKSLEEEEEK